MKKKRIRKKKSLFFNLIKPLLLLFTIVILINVSHKKLLSHKPQQDNNVTTTNIKKDDIKTDIPQTDNSDTQCTKTSSVYNTDNLTNNEFFQDSLFFGDSIIESMSFYDILPEKNVLGIKGLSVYAANKKVDNLLKYNPKKIFILLGNNDLFNKDLTSSTFIDEYSTLVDNIKSKLPTCKIYVLSILPVTKKAEKQHPFLNKQRIDLFNNKLMKMCEKKNLTYLNIVPALEDSEKYFEPDGIHPVCKFYNKLLKYLRNEYLKNN